MASITLKNIMKKYEGNVVAVHDFNLEIKDKEFIILVGPSGCGKSTTLRMIAGLEDITSGGLYIGNTLVNDVQPKDRDIAMVFQSYALYPHMTVYQNMAFGLEMRKVPKQEIKEKISEVAKILDIDALLDRKPKQLSGGQRQRVALGRAIVRDPAVFLLDEPLSNLDAKLRTQMRVEITKLHQSLGTTFVYVTHDQTEAMTMGDRIVVMKDGYIQQVDTPINLYNKPCNLFVASFIGSPQINELPSTLLLKNGNYFIQFENILLEIPKSKISNKVFDNYVNQNMILGVRPEDIHVSLESSTTDAAIDATVEVAELMGSEIYLYLDCKGHKLTAKIPSSTNIKSGSLIKIFINLNKIHIFHKESEVNILI